MIYVSTNQELESDLSAKGLHYKIAMRSSLDSTPFSNLEVIKFLDIKQEFVLKQIHPILKTEVLVHTLVNDDPLTAAPLLNSKIDNKKGNYYLLMEKIDLEPLYLLTMNKSIDLYHTIAEKLAYFHLKHNNVKLLKKLGLKEYGIPKYREIISNLGNRVENLSNLVNNESILNENLIKDFSTNIESIKQFFEPIEPTKLTLVHGDFDTGNLIVNRKDKGIYAIDYGLAHIDIPVIDIAHLLSATEMSISTRREIFETYFAIAGKLFPAHMSLQDVRNAGKIMHMLFFLDWYLTAIETNMVSEGFYMEQIHNRVNFLTGLLKNAHD